MKQLKFKPVKFGDIFTAQATNILGSKKNFVSFRFINRDARQGNAITKDLHDYFNFLLRQAIPNSFSTWIEPSFLGGYGSILGSFETTMSSNGAKQLVKDLLITAGLPVSVFNNGSFEWDYKTQTQINAGQTSRLPIVLTPAQTGIQNTNTTVNQTVNDISAGLGLDDISGGDVGKFLGMTTPALLVLGGLGLVLFIQASR